jgi:hypothetical protein
MATRRKQTKQPMVHPMLRELFGTMLLAGNVEDAVLFGVTRKAFEWVKEGVGRSFQVSNTGKDVELSFSIGGREINPPF